jgi:hypothetical protein
VEKIEMKMKIETKIPKQLQKNGIGFVKLKPLTKIPIEKNWQNKPYTYEEIQLWIEQNGNYGVIGGCNDLVIVDADDELIADVIIKKFPKTLTIKTPRKGYHFYFICKGIDKKIILGKNGSKKKEDHLGEILSKGSQAVGAGSIHPDTGTEYKVEIDAEVTEITREDLYSALLEYISLELPPKDIKNETDEISVVDVLNSHGVSLEQVGTQLAGPHPIHGSTNGRNFCVDPAKNVWHCFRCSSGGGPLSLVAVLEKVIGCEEAKPEGLRGEKFKRVLGIARQKYNLDIKLTSNLLTPGEIAEIKNEIFLIPKDTAKVELPVLLEPILQKISRVSVPQGEAFLSQEIKDHFGLKTNEVKGYEKALSAYRKQTKSDDFKMPQSREEIMDLLSKEGGKNTVHPAQDYTNGILNFAVKINGEPYIVTSDRQLFEIEFAEQSGMPLRHKIVEEARFSHNGIKAFIGSDDSNIGDMVIVYIQVRKYIERYISFSDSEHLDFIALWVIGTYFFMIFRYYPYVWINAEKGSGKTLLMEVLFPLAFNGELITNPTEAVIFRDISNNLTTMFVDEVEQLRKHDKEICGSLISILNSGFNKSGSVKRVEKSQKEGFVVKKYNSYSPKMFAGINEIDDVLQDRTVKIQLLRKKDDDEVHRYKDTAEIQNEQYRLRDGLYIAALKSAKEIAERYQCCDKNKITGLEHLENRELDIWEPILSIANIVDEQSLGITNLVCAMRNLSNKLGQEKHTDNVEQNETCKILSLVKNMLNEEPCMEEKDGIISYDKENVMNYFSGNENVLGYITPNAITSKLKKVGIKSIQKRIKGEKIRVYEINISTFEDMCERFKID